MPTIELKKKIHNAAFQRSGSSSNDVFDPKRMGSFLVPNFVVKYRPASVFDICHCYSLDLSISLQPLRDDGSLLQE